MNEKIVYEKQSNQKNISIDYAAIKFFIYIWGLLFDNRAFNRKK